MKTRDPQRTSRCSVDDLLTSHSENCALSACVARGASRVYTIGKNRTLSLKVSRTVAAERLVFRVSDETARRLLTDIELRTQPAPTTASPHVSEHHVRTLSSIFKKEVRSWPWKGRCRLIPGTHRWRYSHQCGFRWTPACREERSAKHIPHKLWCARMILSLVQNTEFTSHALQTTFVVHRCISHHIFM